MNQDFITNDVRDNKVKEGLMVKQSRHIKEWRERWMVLTKTHLYSFSKKGSYDNPTEAVPLKDVQTVKSFYKGQYKKPHVFRLQTDDIHLYLSVNTNEEKWSWMTAIQKMINKLNNQNQTDTHTIIRETLKMVGALRQTLFKSQKPPQDIITKLQMKSVDSQVDSPLKKKPIKNQNQQIIESQSTSKQLSDTNNSKIQSDEKGWVQIINNKPVGEKIEQKAETVKIEEIKSEIKIVQKQKIVERQKIVEVQKIVYVPKIEQRIVEKYIYESVQNDKDILLSLFNEIITNKSKQNPKYMVDFLVYVLCSQLTKYKKTILQFCLIQQTQRFFAEIFLLMLNDQNQEETLNNYWKFLIIMYESSQQYLYMSDIKVLIDIIMREIQMNRSQLNQGLIMSLLLKMSVKSWWKKINHRRDQLISVVKELGLISDTENQMISQELLPLL